jgi:hypothetical protein
MVARRRSCPFREEMSRPSTRSMTTSRRVCPAQAALIEAPRGRSQRSTATYVYEGDRRLAGSFSGRICYPASISRLPCVAIYLYG